MPLEPGLQLGPYEIAVLIGTGGMGEVYRARDTRLGRTVAIKVLAADIADKPALRERFEREAQSISALNHPAICTLHDVGRHDGLDYLVMEFLEGETLADRLARGPIPLKEALAIAAQIGEGLEAAHRHGIVHRDLKPANVMLVKVDGARSAVQPKLLDFGLAKLRGGVSDATPVVVSAARTDVGSLTAVGTVLGTLQYMSPEQLQGTDADARSDIFALGTVLHEMLTGRKAFEGKSQVSLMAAILEQDPPSISSLQPVSPRALDHVVRGCLAKDPGERWQSVADVVKQVKWIAEESAKPAEIDVPRRGVMARERVAWAAGLLVFAIVAGVLVSRLLLSPAATTPVISFEVPPPSGGIFPGANFTPRMAVSPNGQYVAFTADLQDEKPSQLWIRRLDSAQSTQLVTPTDITGEAIQQPFWSPDSRFVGFFVGDTLKKVDVASAVVQTICNVAGNQFGGTWNSDGTILFGSSASGGLWRVPASSGVPVQVTTLDATAKETAHLWPKFLPDGRHFVYQAHASSVDGRTIFAGSLDATDRTLVLKSPYMVEVAAPDHLMYVRDSALFVQRFDMNARRLGGEPVVVAQGVQASISNGRAAFSASATGVLVYRRGQASTTGETQLAWLDRTGKEVGVVGSPASYRGLELSHDEQRAVVHIEETNGAGDLWVIDLVRGSTSRLTFDPVQHNMAPAWSNDGRRIVFARRGGNNTVLVERDSSGVGDERMLYESKFNDVAAWSVSPDGTTLVFSELHAVTARDLMLLSLAGTSVPSAYSRAPLRQDYGQISPDGRWMAYGSAESGRDEVYVQSFPKGNARYQVSTGGGYQPRWRRDGRELFYRMAPSSGGLVSQMAVAIEPAESGLRFGLPSKLFAATFPTTAHTPPVFNYAVASAGQRFLVARATGTAGDVADVPLTVVVNWDAAINDKRR